MNERSLKLAVILPDVGMLYNLYNTSTLLVELHKRSSAGLCLRCSASKPSVCRYA